MMKYIYSQVRDAYDESIETMPTEYVLTETEKEPLNQSYVSTLFVNGTKLADNQTFLGYDATGEIDGTRPIVS
jgi:hypothetical protein